MDTMRSTVASSLRHTRQTAPAEEITGYWGEAGLAKSSKAKAQTAFSFTSCVRQDYSQKRLNSSPREGLTNHTWASSSNICLPVPSSKQMVAFPAKPNTEPIQRDRK